MLSTVLKYFHTMGSEIVMEGAAVSRATGRPAQEDVAVGPLLVLGVRGGVRRAGGGAGAGRAERGGKPEQPYCICVPLYRTTVHGNCIIYFECTERGDGVHAHAEKSAVVGRVGRAPRTRGRPPR